MVGHVRVERVDAVFARHWSSRWASDDRRGGCCRSSCGGPDCPCRPTSSTTIASREPTSSCSRRLFKQDARCSFEELKEKRYVEFPLEFPAPWVEQPLRADRRMEARPAGTARAMARVPCRRRGRVGRARSRWCTARGASSRSSTRSSASWASRPTSSCIPTPQPSTESSTASSVRVHTKSGEIVVVAKVDPTMRKGVGSISHGHLARQRQQPHQLRRHGPARRHGPLLGRPHRDRTGRRCIRARGGRGAGVALSDRVPSCPRMTSEQTTNCGGFVGS